MNTRKRIILAALLLLVATISPLVAHGMKEGNPQALTVRVLATIEQYGQKTFIAKDAMGNDVTFTADYDSNSSWPVMALTKGDYLEIVLDGHYADEIRWVTPLAEVGALGLTIPLVGSGPLESLEDRFSYTYGFLLLQSFASQGLFFDGGYYTKGAIDGYNDSFSEVQRGFFTIEELYENVERYQFEVWDAGLAREEFGKAYTSIEEVRSLAKPTDLTDIFSYTYGYMLALNLTGQGLTVDGDLYAQGALDYASDNPLLLSEAEMQVTFLEYQEVMEAEYEIWLAEIAQSNLAVAEAFLEANKANDDIVVTPSGLQFQVLTKGDGPKPTMADTVEVNYQLQLADGTMIDSSYDRGESAHFAMFMLTAGFQEAVLNMNVGSVVRAWVHPELGYGEQGNEMILPNSLLVFDIELLGIDE